MKYISLFAGIGGFDLALENLGHECVYANEWDRYAAQTYEKHFKKPDTRDITTVPSSDIPDHDLLVGGFPCQAFSVAGKRRGFEDARGTLFFEIARILSDKRPRYILLENVKGLLSHSGGETFSEILRILSELGYDVQWQLLNSKNFGVPQNRERVFIVGNLRGEPRLKIFPLSGASESIDSKDTELNYIGAVMSEKNKEWLTDGKQHSRNFPQGQRVYSADGISATLASQAGGLGAKTGLYEVSGIFQRSRGKNKGGMKDISPTITNKFQDNNHIVIPVLTPDRIKKRQNGRRFKEDGDPSFTLTAQDKHGILIMNKKGGIKPKKIASTLTGGAHSGGNHSDMDLIAQKSKIRRLTPIECERLQGFPDNWTEGISDTQRYKCLGNAVTVNVVEYIVSELFGS